jgi:hypothetical protein
MDTYPNFSQWLLPAFTYVHWYILRQDSPLPHRSSIVESHQLLCVRFIGSICAMCVLKSLNVISTPRFFFFLFFFFYLLRSMYTSNTTRKVINCCMSNLLSLYMPFVKEFKLELILVSSIYSDPCSLTTPHEKSSIVIHQIC